MSTYAEIIERLEKATGPDRKIDYMVFTKTAPLDEFSPWSPLIGNHFTSSIDAAIALVETMLPGQPMIMGIGQTELTRPWARVGSWSGCDAVGSTLPIAILLALFRALEAKENAG